MGLPVAIPAATSAFGGAMAASTVMAPALLSAAAVAAPMAAVGSSMMMAPSIMSAGGAGFFGSLSSAYNAVKPFTSLISAGTSVLQGLGALQQGQAMKQQYKMQALQVESQNEINRLNWITDANERTRRIMAVNASAIASGYARGVSGLDGSVKLLTQTNEKDYLRDVQRAEFNQNSSDNFASAEASLLRTAGDVAISGSKFEALGYVGSAYKLFEESKVGG